MITITDPTFLGTAIYGYVGFKTLKLSRLQALRLSGDNVEFDTLNTRYSANFTDVNTKKVFIDTCRTILGK